MEYMIFQHFSIRGRKRISIFIKLSATHAFNCIVLMVMFGRTSCKDIPPVLQCGRLNSKEIDLFSVRCVINKAPIEQRSSCNSLVFDFTRCG